MGMYNEVSKACPKCGCINEIQIRQITLGFGDFDLDTGRNLKDLTVKELEDLIEELEKEKTVWYCRNPNCNQGKYAYKERRNSDNLKEQLILKITGP